MLDQSKKRELQKESMACKHSVIPRFRQDGSSTGIGQRRRWDNPTLDCAGLGSAQEHAKLIAERRLDKNEEG